MFKKRCVRRASKVGGYFLWDTIAMFKAVLGFPLYPVFLSFFLQHRDGLWNKKIIEALKTAADHSCSPISPSPSGRIPQPLLQTLGAAPPSAPPGCALSPPFPGAPPGSASRPPAAACFPCRPPSGSPATVSKLPFPAEQVGLTGGGESSTEDPGHLPAARACVRARLP